MCDDPKLDGRKISYWYQKFCFGQDDIKDKEGSGRLRTANNTSEEIIAIILEEDTRMIYEEIAMESVAPKLSIHRVLPRGIRKKEGNCPLHGITQISTDCFHLLQERSTASPHL